MEINTAVDNIRQELSVQIVITVYIFKNPYVTSLHNLFSTELKIYIMLTYLKKKLDVKES